MLLLDKFRFCSLLALSCLFVISRGYSDSEYLTEEAQRLEKYVETLKESLNNELDPCEHFLEYVNGSKAGDLPLPEQPANYLYESIIQQKSNREVIVIRNLHLSCENLPDNYFDAVKDLDIKGEIMSFPLLDKYWANYDFSLAVFEAKAMPYGASLFISGEAIKTNNGDIKFKIEPSDESFNLSEDLMIEILRHYEVDWDEAIDLAYGEMKQFGKYYRQVKKDYGKVLNPFEDPKKMTVGELKEKYPNLIWDQYLAVISHGARFSDNDEVSIKYEDKLSYFHDFYPSKVNRTVALYYLFNLHAYLKGEHDFAKRRCDLETIHVLSDLVAYEVLEDFVNPHDAISFTDTATAMLKTHDVLTNSGLHLERVNQLVSKKDDYKKNIDHAYRQTTANKDNFFSNYVKIMATKKLRTVPEEFTTNYKEGLHILTFAHLKPRLVLPVIWGLKHFYSYNELWLSEPSVCTHIYTTLFHIKTVMDFIDNLEQLDNDKYQNDLNTLVKHGLTPRQLVFLILGQHYALKAESTTEFQKNIRAMKTFNNEFNCPIDSATSELYNQCKYL